MHVQGSHLLDTAIQVCQEVIKESCSRAGI